MKFYQDEAWLWKSYVDEKMSMRAVAEEAGCSYQTIFRYLKLFGIKRPVSKPSEEPGKPTQTLKEAFDKHIALAEALEELEEIQEEKKAYQGLPSNYYVSPADIEANRLKADAEARKERYRQMKEDEEYSKRQSGGGDWFCGDIRDEMQEILELTGDKI